jgi:outer membrane protein
MRDTRAVTLGLFCGLAVLLATRCAAFPPARDIDTSVAPSSGTPWQPPPEARPTPPPTPVPAIPPEYLKPGATLTLPQILDVALRNNPLTRTAWYQARSAAAGVGSKRSAWFPSLELDANLTRQKQTVNGSTGRFTLLQTTYGPSLTLNFLLFDFGGRSADVEEARQALYVANWSHNAAIEDTILLVERQYYAYLNAKAQAAAAEISLKEAQENLNAANARHDAGVATIADVLQAKTAASQAELVLETAQGQVQTIRGALATALGVPANLPVEAGELPGDVEVDRTIGTVDDFIAQAQSQRPDLAAARLAVEKAQAHVRSVRAEGLPRLSAVGAISRPYFYGPDRTVHADNYSGSILFGFPLFTGFQTTYDTLQAKEDVHVAREQAQTLEDQVLLQVWTSYYNLKTSAAQVKTAQDLLASASQSQEVAAGRYKSGVGTILDLLTAQTAYASARAQEAQARANWFLSVAQLAHDTGSLTQAQAPATPASQEKR